MLRWNASIANKWAAAEGDSEIKELNSMCTNSAPLRLGRAKFFRVASLDDNTVYGTTIKGSVAHLVQAVHT